MPTSLVCIGESHFEFCLAAVSHRSEPPNHPSVQHSTSTSSPPALAGPPPPYPPPAHHRQTPAAGSLPHLTPSSPHWAWKLLAFFTLATTPAPLLVGLFHLGPHEGHFLKKKKKCLLSPYALKQVKGATIIVLISVKSFHQ